MVDNVYRRNQWTKLNIHLTNEEIFTTRQTMIMSYVTNDDVC